MEDKNLTFPSAENKESGSGKIRVKLIASVMYGEKLRLSEAEQDLRGILGPEEDLNMVSDFDFTDYYYEEFGRPLERKIIVFKELVPLDKVHLTKVATNLLEEKMAVRGKRTVNVDPGYITETKLVLFSTKDCSHRIYAGDGIFAESTLFFSDGVFNPWPWTYPDYASLEMREFFGKARDVYTKELRVLKKNPGETVK